MTSSSASMQPKRATDSTEAVLKGGFNQLFGQVFYTTSALWMWYSFDGFHQQVRFGDEPNLHTFKKSQMFDPNFEYAFVMAMSQKVAEHTFVNGCALLRIDWRVYEGSWVNQMGCFWDCDCLWLKQVDSKSWQFKWNMCCSHILYHDHLQKPLSDMHLRR